MFAHYFFRVALIAVLALLLVRPAAAVVEQVPPETAYSALVYRWISSGQAYSQSFDGHLESCMLWAAVNKPLATQAVLTSGTTASGTCTLYKADMTWVGSVAFARSSTCPTGYTWNGSQCQNPTSCPVATPPYTYNPATSMCEREAPCPAVGTDLSIGYYDIGDQPVDPLPLSFRTRCNNGCEVNYTGRGVTQGFRAQVSGMYHYFVVGEFNYTGETCVGGEFAPGAITSVPTATCNAGQTLVTGEGGFSKCYDDITGTYVDGNSASAVAAVVAQGDAAYAAMMADTAARMTAMGGTASDVVAAQTIAAGVYAAGGNTSGGTASGADPVMTAFCDENPTASICADQDFGSVSDVTLGNQTVNVSITPVAVGGAGSCPVPSSMVLHGQTYYFVWDTYCEFASGIKPILLTFAWLAAAGILVGGFRS